MKTIFTINKVAFTAITLFVFTSVSNVCADNVWSGTTRTDTTSRTGRVGIGTAAHAAYQLYVYRGSDGSILKATGTNGGIGVVSQTSGSPTLLFSCNSAGSYKDMEIGAANPNVVGLHIVAGTNNIGIGTQTPGSYKLAVEGKLGAREIVTTTATPWPDYVFDKSYKLKPIKEVERDIKTQGHLEGIPTAKEIAENGLSVGEMQVKMMKKIEELTMYVINMNKENEELKARIAKIEHDPK